MVFLLFFAATSWAQTGNARIRGVVSDPTGAVIPQAKVALKNIHTGIVTNTISNADGEYVFPQVSIGAYELSVDATGYKTFVQTGIVLQADQHLTLNTSLTVGASSETIRVEAQAAEVDTQTGTIKDVVNTKSIQELPLNGRDVRQLVALSAGVFQTGGASNSQSSTMPGQLYFSVNGGRTNTVNFMLDGADNNDSYTNVGNPYPSPDALAEFSIQTSNFDAEYGRNSGGIVNAVTKSGTNTFHGSAYEFLRNTSMDANNWFTNHNGLESDSLHRNQFGGTLGGPVRIPHVYNGKDKTFFFVSYEKTLNHYASSAGYMLVPTQVQRNGDLSALAGVIYDPATYDPSTGQSQPFAGNVIPSNRINAAAAKFINDWLPLPNSQDPSNPNRYSYTLPRQESNGNFTVRGDHNVSNNERLMVRYNHYGFQAPQSPVVKGLYPEAVAGFGGLNHNASIALTSTITPRLVNMVTFGYDHLYTDSNQLPSGYPTSTDLGLKVYSSPPNPIYFFVNGWTAATNLQPGVQNNRNAFPLTDVVNWQVGHHLIKFGGAMTRIQQSWIWNNAYPNYSFWGTYTSQNPLAPSGYTSTNALADFLLGYPWALSESNPQALNTRFTSWSAFVQDNYKVTDRLTLDLGLRWDPWIPPHMAGKNMVTVFDPQAFAQGTRSTVYPNAPPGVLFAGDNGVPEGGVNASWKNFAPRIGFAYDLTGDQKTVLRGGYGIFYDQPKNDIYNRFATGAPFTININRQNAMTATPFSWSDPWQGGTDPLAVSAESGYVPGSSASFYTPISGYLTFTDFHMPYTQQWNLTAERKLLGGTLRAAYIGSKSTHLLWTRDGNPPVPGTGDPSTWSSTDARRKYAPYYSWMNWLYFDGWSNYNSLQLSYQRRFNHGFTASVNYNRSKSMDSNSDSQEYVATAPQNPYDLTMDRGLSDFDVPNNLVMSFVWELPVPTTHNRILDGVVQGWQANGIISIHSGTPFSIYAPCDCMLTSWPWQRAKQVSADASLSTNRSSSDLVAKYFNTGAFTLPALADFNGIATRNSLRGPGYKNMDFSLFKNFTLEQVQVQFRAEAFNVFNHPNFGGVSNVYGSSTFGQLTSASSARVMQLALRISF